MSTVLAHLQPWQQKQAFYRKWPSNGVTIWRISSNSNNGGGSISDSIFTHFKVMYFMYFKTPLQIEPEFNLELHKSCDTKLTPGIEEIENIGEGSVKLLLGADLCC